MVTRLFFSQGRKGDNGISTRKDRICMSISDVQFTNCCKISQSQRSLELSGSWKIVLCVENAQFVFEIYFFPLQSPINIVYLYSSVFSFYTISVPCVCVLSHSVMSDSCDPMNCSLPCSSVHGILQARILEWVPISFSITIYI